MARSKKKRKRTSTRKTRSASVTGQFRGATMRRVYTPFYRTRDGTGFPI
jgi:hypothetical protein